MREIEIIATAEDAGARIDKFLVNRRIYPGSRAGIACRKEAFWSIRLLLKPITR